MMQNKLIKEIAALLMATGIMATTAFAAPPKLQFQYLAFPETCVESSIGSFQLLMVNNGATGSVAGSDHVLVTIPFGNQPDDFLGNTTALTCGAQSPLWNCAVQSITADTVTVSLYPTSGTVPVKAGETLYFYLDSAQVNAVAGMAKLDVTQNIDPGRASNPQNTQMSILKVSEFAAAYMEIDPTVVPSVKDGVDWTELTGIPAGFADGIDNSGPIGVTWSDITNIPAGFADGVDNTGLTTESDPTVPANIKDGIAWNEISGIPTSLLDGDQTGITSESDPQVGSNTTNRVPKWDGNALVSSIAINENAAGNVGIGVASPAQKLDINGAAAIRGMLFVGASGSDSDIRKNTVAKNLNFRDYGGVIEMTLDKTGNLGIGTTAPTTKLDVSGDTKVSGVLTAGKIQVIDVVTEGSSCTPNGLIARDTNGLILSCQSGVWKRAGGAGSATTGAQVWAGTISGWSHCQGHLFPSFAICNGACPGGCSFKGFLMP